MHHELFEELQYLLSLNSEEQEDRLSELLDLHDSGQAYQ